MASYLSKCRLCINDNVIIGVIHLSLKVKSIFYLTIINFCDANIWFTVITAECEPENHLATATLSCILYRNEKISHTTSKKKKEKRKSNTMREKNRKASVSFINIKKNNYQCYYLPNRCPEIYHLLQIGCWMVGKELYDV